jgi:hypothetical protein
MADDVVRIVDIKYTTPGADAAAAAHEKVAGALGDVVVAADKTEKANASVGRSYESLQKRVDVTYRAMAQQQTALADLDKAKGAGLVTDQRYAQLQGLIAQRYNETVSAAGNAGKATAGFTATAGLARHELINLSRQAQDVAVSLGSGQSFGTVLLQQGSQIGDVFANSTGTLKGFFSQIAEGAERILTPARLVGGAVTAIGISAVVAGHSWAEAHRDIEKALIGIGRTSGANVEDVNRVAAQAALATNTSFADAQAGATQLLQSGAVYKTTFAELNLLTDKFALATGTTTVEAAKKLGEAFADPVKGAQSLNKEYGFLSAATLQQIRTYQELGNAQAAQLTLIKAFEPTLDQLNEKTGTLTTAWRGLWNAGSNVASMLGSALSGGSDEEQLSRLKSQRSQIVSQNSVVGPSGKLELPDPELIAGINKQIAEFEARIAAAGAAASTAHLDKLGLQVDAITRAVLPAIEQLSQLEQAYNKLATAKELGASDPESDAAGRAIQVQRALLIESSAEAERYNQRVAEIALSYDDVGTSTALALQASQNQLPVISAIGGAAKMAAQYAADYANAIDKGKTATEAAAIAADRLGKSQAAAAASAAQTTQGLKNQNDLAAAGMVITKGRSALQIADAQASAVEDERRIASAQAYEAVIKQIGDTEEGRAAAKERANEVERSYDEKALAAKQRIEEILDRIHEKNLAWQQDMLGVSAAAQQVAAAAQQAAEAWENAARAASDAAGGSFGGFDVPQGTQYTSTVADPLAYLSNQTTTDLVSQVFAKGGTLYDAINKVQGAQNSSGLYGSSGQLTDENKTSTLQQLYQLVNAQTTDKTVQLQNDYKFLAWLQSRPETIQRDQAIVSLTSDINSLTKAIQDNTGATSDLTASLPPVLSSLYRSGNVKGFGFGDGGIMTPFGAAGLRTYGDGGVVSAPTILGIAGERYQPEAIIPLKNGAVPVQLSGAPGRGGAVYNISAPVTLNIMVGSDDAGAAIQQSAVQATMDLQAMIEGFARR